MMKKLVLTLFAIGLVLTFTQCNDSFLAVAQIDDKYGFLDSDGSWKIKAEYDLAGQFSEGWAYIEQGDSAFFIDVNNNVQIKVSKFKNVPFYHNDYAVVEFEHGGMGLMDRQGKIIIEGFKRLGKLQNGLMKAEQIKPNGELTRGYIDITGEWIIELCSTCVVSDFKEGLALVRFENEQWGYISPNGKLNNGQLYTYATDYSEGFASVSNDNKTLEIIDIEGNKVIPGTYISATPFNEGISIVMSQDFKRYFLNYKGDTLLKSKYSDYTMRSFYSGLAFIRIDSKNYFINKSEEIQFEIEGQAEDFRNNFAVVEVDNEYALIDINGLYVIDPVLQRCGDMVDPDASNDFWIFY